MKKFTILFLISLLLFFNMMIVTSFAQANIFKEGFYKVSDYNFSPTALYDIQNVSINDRVYVMIFDGNQNLQQSIRLKSQSSKYKLIALQPEYRIVVVGNGEISIS